jgi:hypothetical protein
MSRYLSEDKVEDGEKKELFSRDLRFETCLFLNGMSSWDSMMRSKGDDDIEWTWRFPYVKYVRCPDYSPGEKG